MVLSALLTPTHGFHPLWQLAVVELAEPLSMRAIARMEGGYTDTIRDAHAAWSPLGAYFVSLTDQTLGVIFPAERQFASRWVELARNNRQSVLSEYLQAASQRINDRVQIVMALDLADVVHEQMVLAKLEEADGLKVSASKARLVAQTVASLRGATLRIALDKSAKGQLTIEFEEDTSPLESIAKELVLGALRDLGAEISDLDEWKARTMGKTIDMRGDLSTDALRRVFSVIELPTSALNAKEGQTPKDGQDQDDTEPPTTSEIREKSLTYFKSVNVWLDDLRKGLKKTKATSSWTERYAKKIDQLPILHVDGELLDYSAELTQGLRGIALTKRQAGIDAGVRTAQDYGKFKYRNTYAVGVGYNYGYRAGPVRNDATASALNRARIKREALSEASRARVEGWKQIDDATLDIRRRMTEKYGVEF